MSTTTERTISEIAAETPSSIRVFESLGIDYCCGGKRSLAEACARAGIGMDSVLKLLDAAEHDAQPSDQTQWSNAPLTALIAEIVGRHHAFVRREIPRLNALAAKVANKHGESHREVQQIEQIFNALGEELSMHLMKEEQILFPYISGMESGGAAPPSCFGTVTRPIANMVAEHDDAGALLAKMRELSSGYQLPEGACLSYHALYQGLAEFERDLHQHIHLENNILFPRAVEMERRQQATGA